MAVTPATLALVKQSVIDLGGFEPMDNYAIDVKEDPENRGVIIVNITMPQYIDFVVSV